MMQNYSVEDKGLHPYAGETELDGDHGCPPGPHPLQHIPQRRQPDDGDDAADGDLERPQLGFPCQHAIPVYLHHRPGPALRRNFRRPLRPLFFET